MERSTLVPRVLVSLVLSGLSSAALAAASGTVTSMKETWKVADGIAWKNDEGALRVTLAGGALDRKEIAKDGKIDDFDFIGLAFSTLTLKIEADGTMNCVDFTSKRGGGSSCGSLGQGLKLTKNTPTEVAGTMKANASDDVVDVQFSLPVEGKIARAGTALPAGGGDAGKALLATIAAVQTGDLTKIKAVSPPDRVKAIEASEKSGEAKDMVEMMKLMTPTITKVTGGTVDGDSATLDWTGTEGGQAAKGTADMKKIGGQWYMTGVSTRN